MGKSRRESEGKKERKSSSAVEPITYLSPIAKPLANDKQTKRFLRLTKKGAYQNDQFFYNIY